MITKKGKNSFYSQVFLKMQKTASLSTKNVNS